ncbi:MAG TPA: S41 family peptidase [Rhizomicrobium sp.]|jgi:carboxyl-terminal processing protease|nr:S41 family peptidase [Rhizomicrobium sp.]
MKKFAFVGIGMVAGFVAALGLLPAAHGANDMSAYRQLDLFSDAFERVRANYVRPVDDSELINAAIEGMVSNLDPHSSYMDAKAFADMQIQTRGSFGGIGIEVTMENGLVKVISPIDNTPASKAGLKAGDYIAAINGASVQGLNLNDAIDKMRGPIGSKITLTILRTNDKTAPKKPFDVTLARAEVAVDEVRWHREGDVGYIRMPGFNENTASGLENAVRDLKKQIGPGLKGYVLDLRNNPGGLLDQAVQVSDDMLTSGEVVSTRGRHAEDTQRYDAHPGDITDGKPVIVLVNAGTASASEIVAGALQDHHRATILGMTSFGKGSVQTIIPLGEGGGALRLTTARYYTPSGHSIQAQGIIPDIMVAAGNEDDIPKIARPSEADLPGHLAGEPVTPKANQTIIRPPANLPKNGPDGKPSDFQLSYALDLLHGKVAALPAKSASN